MPLENQVETDVLVIGGGIAGCFAAIKAKEQGLDVTIVDKAYAGKSGASMGVCRSWMVFNPEWGLDFDACMNEFTVRGEYINHREWDEIILKESLAIYQDMVSWGAKFPPDALKYIKEWPPFGDMRVLHREYPPVLRKQAEKVGVRVMDRIMLTDLLKQDGKIVGAIGFSYDTGDLYIFKAKATILTAGSSSLKPTGYEIHMLTGDAEGMAYRAGAEVTGKEFYATHYSWAHFPAWRAHRGSDAEFPYFTDAEGERVGIGSLLGFEPNLSMEFVVHAGRGPIIWDLNAATDEQLERMLKRPQEDGSSPIEHERIGDYLRRRGKIRLTGGADAGYSNVGTAGVWVINTKGATGLPGLYAAGDCGGTRHNGAYICNPGLGSCPSAVTGRRAGAGAAEYALQAEKSIIDKRELARLKEIMYTPTERKSGFSPRWVTQLLQNTMIPYFILYIKHGERLRAALTIVEFLRDHLVPKLMAKDSHELRLAHETKNMILSSEMMLRASLFRTESRGTHYREDYPRRDDPTWLAWTKIKEEQGRMSVLKEPIPKEWWPDLSKPYEERYPIRFPGE